MISPVHRIMVIAGEASGDKIAARALREVHRLCEKNEGKVDIYGIGGDECAKEGMDCYYSAREMSVVGFIEVAKRARFFKRVLARMQDLLKHQDTRPDVLVLVDYPGFNIRMARAAKAEGIRVVYYVSPQVWAWHGKRVQELKEIVDEMLVIFPFEQDIYRKAGLANAHFIGHPLCEIIKEEALSFGPRDDFARRFGLDETKPWLVVFAGSRKEEVKRLLPVLSKAALSLSERHDYQPILVKAGTVLDDYYEAHGGGAMLGFRHPTASHELMHHADLGILKSGTTTLEAALLRLPGVICYKTHPITFAIGKRLVKLPYIGLANIVIGEKVYPELLQSECTPSRIVAECEKIMVTRDTFKTKTEGLIDKLLPSRVSPSRRAAESIMNV